VLEGADISYDLRDLIMSYHRELPEGMVRNWDARGGVQTRARAARARRAHTSLDSGGRGFTSSSGAGTTSSSGHGTTTSATATASVSTRGNDSSGSGSGSRGGGADSAVAASTLVSMLRESRESPWAETGSGSSISGPSSEGEDFDQSFASGFTQSTLSVQRAPRDYQDQVYEVKQEFSSANAAAALALDTSAPADADELPYGCE